MDQTWSVSVPVAYQNWLVVSATPSFDPNIGTESPGDAEHYPVTLNPYREKMVLVSQVSPVVYISVLALRKMPILYQLKNPILNLDISICHIIRDGGQQ